MRTFLLYKNTFCLNQRSRCEAAEGSLKSAPFLARFGISRKASVCLSARPSVCIQMLKKGRVGDIGYPETCMHLCAEMCIKLPLWAVFQFVEKQKSHRSAGWQHRGVEQSGGGGVNPVSVPSPKELISRILALTKIRPSCPMEVNFPLPNPWHPGRDIYELGSHI